MKLKGKAQQLFEEWYIKKYPTDTKNNPLNLRVGQSVTEGFYKLPPEMQKGVYEAFADSLGYVITLDYGFRKYESDAENKCFQPIINDKGFNGGQVFNTRLEAFESALKELETILNK